MGIKAKIISYILIISMLLTGFAYATGGLNSSNVNTSGGKQSFSDIENHWCQGVIEKFLNKGWVVGYDDGLFRPNRLVTRAEFTAMVVNIFKEEKQVEGNSFTDVNKNNWFYNAVSYGLYPVCWTRS